MTTTTPVTSATKLGPLVRLWGIGKDELPAQDATGEDLRPFLAAILGEAAPFIDSAAPASAGGSNQAASGTTTALWKSDGRDKTHRDTAAPVARTHREVTAGELDRVIGTKGVELKKDGDNDNTTDGDNDDKAPESVRARRERDRRPQELWFCRLSVHEDAAQQGTASWAEFDRYHRREHAQSEMKMAPNVIGAHEAVQWRGCAGVEVSLDGDGNDGASGVTVWHDFTLGVVEMRHKVGRPVLRDRTFPVLQMTCTAKSSSDEEFLVVSIPVPDFGKDERSKLAREPGAQIAFYASIERIRKLREPADKRGQIEWVMAVASDAGGILPMWMQTAALPGVVWKDVPIFFAWLVKVRQGSSA